MKIVGVIAEFNPFHNGHARLLSHAKKELGADYVIAVMSGDFVQRGEPACQSRRVRAHEALAAGFDAVFALPVGISTASAEGFARGGVRALDALGCVDTLLFGSESGDLPRLEACAAALLREEPSRVEVLKHCLKEGLSYPAARARAFPEYADLLERPNNILAVEYCKALLASGSALRPQTLIRTGSYHESQASDAPSAETIRRQADLYMENRQADLYMENRQACAFEKTDVKADCSRERQCPFTRSFCEEMQLQLEKETTSGSRMENGGLVLRCRPHALLRQYEKDIQELPAARLRQTTSVRLPAELHTLARRTMPAASADIFLEDIRKNGLVTPEDFSLLLSASLFKAVSFEDYLPFAGVTEDLARRFFEKRARFTSYRAFAESVRSKNTTLTAVSRALLSILLELPKGAETSLPYLRILGYRKDAQPLLQKIAANASVPVLYRIAEAEAIAARPEAKAHLRREMVSQSLYEAVRAKKTGQPPRPDHALPLLRL